MYDFPDMIMVNYFRNPLTDVIQVLAEFWEKY